jgi:hypothetical protein
MSNKKENRRLEARLPSRAKWLTSETSLSAHAAGNKINLDRCHDFVWKNSNVPTDSPKLRALERGR